MAEDRRVHGQKYPTWGKWAKQHLKVVAALHERIGRILHDCADAGVVTPDNARQLVALGNALGDALRKAEYAFQAIAEELHEHIGRILRDCADAGVITPDNARQLAALANALEIEEDAFQAIAEELLR